MLKLRHHSLMSRDTEICRYDKASMCCLLGQRHYIIWGMQALDKLKHALAEFQRLSNNFFTSLCARFGQMQHCLLLTQTVCAPRIT